MSVVRKSCRVWKKVMKKKRPLKQGDLGWQIFGSNLVSKSDRTYELSAVGQVEAGTNHILWTWRIGQVK